ncbi:MAG: Hsp70 family protein [Synergistaceae bacterium]|nr:Hsp70 family protein [Synergistaceae bacterium]
MARAFLGIDFGTAQTSVALLYEGGIGDPEIITINGKTTIVTALRLGCGDPFYGNEAKEKIDEAPQNTFFSFKQKVGNNVGKIYPPEGKSYTPEELALVFLTWLREKVERGKFNVARLADIPNLSCVIGCPATWDDEHQHVLAEIAEKAGFPRVTTCCEPLGVVHYHLHKKDGLSSEKPQNVLVYDFGGGTTDVAIERIEPASACTPQIEILATAGISDLGGRNFDARLGIFFMEQLKSQNISVKNYMRGQLEIAAQDMKERLMERLSDGRDSADKKYEIGNAMPKLSLTKTQFDEVCASLIEDCKKPVIKALDLARLKENDIAAVILAGGSSSLYYIKPMIADLFPSRKVIRSTNPVEVVAKGLALKALHDACGIAKSESGQGMQFVVPPRIDLAKNDDDREIDGWWENLPRAAKLVLDPMRAIGHKVMNIFGLGGADRSDSENG